MRKTILIVTLAIVGVVLVLLYKFNPIDTSFAPRCAFKVVTAKLGLGAGEGWSCTGCGMQRFIHAFLHGRFIEAIQYNYMMLIFIPYIVLFGIKQLVLGEEKRKQWGRVLEGRTMTIAMAILVPGWVVVRNILHI